MGKWCLLAVCVALVITGCETMPTQITSVKAAHPETTAHPPRPLGLLYTTFQDHAVLQRDKPIHVWGQTKPGAQVTVSFAGETGKALADVSGHWETILPPRPAGGPYQLSAKSSAGESQTITDVMMGDVYLCSGQSNMEMPLRVVSNYDSDILSAKNTMIRLFHVERFSSPVQRRTFGADATWSVTSPQTVREFSAVCYLFGRNLQPTTNVPLGLIEDAWGGSLIQAWISPRMMRDVGGYAALLDILDEYAVSPNEGSEKWRGLMDAWWLAHDPARRASPPWTAQTFDDNAWSRIIPNGTWREWNVPLLKTFNGTVWLHKAFDVSAAQAKQAATLELGPIDQSDTAWINGVEVGELEGYDVDRRYRISVGALHEGKNLLALGIFGGAGLLNPADQISIKFGDGTIVHLSGLWRYNASVDVNETGYPPHVPWLNQFGLSVLYNGMIEPLGPTAIRGILWYQGESDAYQPREYARLLPTLIDNWRQRFGSDTPFFIVQLPGFGPAATKPQNSDWAALREVERRVANTVPNTDLAVTIDLGQRDNIHPTNKEEVGRRLALLAERKIYGKNVVASGPTPAAVVRRGRTIEVTFDNVADGLAIYEWNRAVGFQLCNAAGICRYASGVPVGHRIDLDGSQIRNATEVRFCWSDSPICNVYNSSGLPAVPFEMAISSPQHLRKALTRKPHHRDF